MSTSDAFTVPCFQPSEYFPKPSLAWLLHSASSQVFAFASLSLFLSDLNAPPNYSWILSSTFLFPSWISTSYLLLHSVPPLAHSSSLSFLLLIFLFFPFASSFFKPSSFYHFLWSHSLVLVLCCTMIIISFSIQFLIECQHLICPLCLACPISQQ